MIITLSGSAKRFEHGFIDAQHELSKRGVLCFSLAVLPSTTPKYAEWSDGSISKVMGDLLYYKRIAESDAVLVLGDGYIGESTAKEILWAYIQAKLIFRQRSYPDVGWDSLVARFHSRMDDGVEMIQKARGYFGG